MVYRLPAMISFLKLLLFLWFPWQHIVLGVLLFPLSLIILAGPSSSSQTRKARIPQLCTVFSLFILPSIDRWSQLLLWLQLPSVSQWQTNLYLQWLRHPDQWGWGPAGHQTSHNCFKGMIRHSTFSSLPPSPKKKKKKMTSSNLSYLSEPSTFHSVGQARKWAVNLNTCLPFSRLYDIYLIVGPYQLDPINGLLLKSIHCWPTVTSYHSLVSGFLSSILHSAARGTF